MKDNYLINQKNEDSDSIIQLDQEDARSTGDSSSKMQSTVEYFEGQIPEDVIQKNLSHVPEEFQDTFIHA